jgi:chromosome segregation ATPase
MTSTPDSSRVVRRRRGSKHPSTPETTCSSEQGFEAYLEVNIEPKAEVFKTFNTIDQTRNESHFHETKDNHSMTTSDTRNSGDGIVPSNRSAVARAERQMMEDDNSILASQHDNHSHLSNLDFFDFMLDTEEDSTYCLDSDDSDIQAAIDDIRKEASQLDQLILYDQLKTLECELEAVNRQYSARSMENDDLKAQLEEKEDLCANLELERDLHRADATKLREDLKTCVEKMFDISLYETSIEAEGNSTKVGKMKRILLEAPSGEHDDREEAANDATPPQQLRILGLSSHPRKVLRNRLPALSDPGLLTLSSKQKWSEDSDSAHLLPSHRQVEPLPNQDVFRKRGRRSFRRQRNKPSFSQSFREDRDFSMVEQPLTERKTHHEQGESDQEENETKICGIFRRRSRQGQLSSKESEIQLMRNQIRDLQEVMKTSLSSSEKLRKRIAIISRYYEGVIAQLQGQVVEIKAEKCRKEIDLKNQLSEAERKLSAKDKEIARLKAALPKVDQGEV